MTQADKTGDELMREEFESFMESRGFGCSWLDLNKSGDYDSALTQGRWDAWQAAKQTPMVYDPTLRQSLLTQGAIDAGKERLCQYLEKHARITHEQLVIEIFHIMEAKPPHFVPAHKDSYLPASTERKT